MHTNMKKKLMIFRGYKDQAISMLVFYKYFNSVRLYDRYFVVISFYLKK